ncbi:hypothetical protein BGZ61DRAFT_315944, partial [Ilyonectria robusta]|uniref:uncharacterized protein n=1 Tax=Ilyonectria robusta TaxID=1079257 RepID=UPI001E8D3C66
YQPLRYRPIAISIETKTPDGSGQEAKTQVSVWAAAYMARLRALSGTSKSAMALGVTLPLVTVRGGEWSVLFAKDQVDGIDLIEMFVVGNTSCIVGCYKVIALLR